MVRDLRPFRVYKTRHGWALKQQVQPHCTYGTFATPGEAIDYAYRNWPWWP